MTFEETTISSEYIYKGKVFNVRKDKVNTVGGTSYREIIEHSGGVGIASLHDGKLLMIRQFRKAAEDVVWEIPAGKFDPGETDGLQVAVRELKEETGYEGENWRFMTKFYGTIGYDNEIIRIYGCDATVKGETDFDPSEAIDLYEIEVPKLLEMIDSGEIIDGKTIIAILMTAREMGL